MTRPVETCDECGTVRPSADPKTDAIWGIAVGSMHGALAKTREEMGL
jgi:hypothetical protein